MMSLIDICEGSRFGEEMDVEMQFLTYYMAGRGVDVMMPLIDICEGSRFGEEMDVEMQFLTYYMARRGSRCYDVIDRYM